MSKQDQILIVGFGGHGKVVLSTLLAAKKKVLGFLDDNIATHGTSLWGYRVLGAIERLNEFSDYKAVCAVGNNAVRKKIHDRYPNISWQSIVHPRAYVHESVLIGKGTVVFAGAIVQPDCVIGDQVIINTNSSIDHDCQIQNFVHIAPGVSLAGNVCIDEGSFLGIGSCVIPNTCVKKWAVIGAGGVVTSEIPDYTLAKGIPAKVYKNITRI